MGLFARFTCLRRSGTAEEFARTVRDLLRARNVVETEHPAAAERLLMIAPAGNGWLMVVDHVEGLSQSMEDPDGLLEALSQAPGTVALEIAVADSDDMMLALVDCGKVQSHLGIGRRGFQAGALEPWRRVLAPGQSVQDIRKGFAGRPTFVEEHFPALKLLFGIDLAAFDDVGKVQSGRAPRADAVLLRLKAVPAPGQTIGPPTLEVDDVFRDHLIRTRTFPHIPRGLIATVPPFRLGSRGGGARGLAVRLTGSALNQGLIEIVSANLMQRHPVEANLNRDIRVTPEVNAAHTVLRFHDVEVPDWVQPDPRTMMHAKGSLQDLFVYVHCRALKAGDGVLEAEAHLVAPESAPIRTACPVTVLPEMWRPLKGSEQPREIEPIHKLHRPARVNGLAVLRGGAEQSVSALRSTLETWRSMVDPAHTFSVYATTELPHEGAFFWPADLTLPFNLDLSKKRQAKWDRLMADLPSIQGLRITSRISPVPHDDCARRNTERIVLHYTSAAMHPSLPDEGRLGHVALSLPPSSTAKLALVSLMRALAAEGFVGQAYVATWDGDDGPQGTLYESAAGIYARQLAARSWGRRHLRAVASRIWLGPEFAAMLPDCMALDRVAIVSEIGDTLAIELRPESTLRDLELCLEPMLASEAEAQAFWGRFRPRGWQ